MLFCEQNKPHLPHLQGELKLTQLLAELKPRRPPWLCLPKHQP
jgi:hypothetical protein